MDVCNQSLLRMDAIDALDLECSVRSINASSGRSLSGSIVSQQRVLMTTGGPGQILRFNSYLPGGDYTVMISHLGLEKLCAAVRIEEDGSLSLPVRNQLEEDWVLKKGEGVRSAKVYDPTATVQVSELRQNTFKRLIVLLEKRKYLMENMNRRKWICAQQKEALRALILKYHQAF